MGMTRKAQLLVAAVAIVVAGAVALVLVLSSEDEPANQATPNQQPPTTSQAGPACENVAILHLNTDKEMTDLADELRGDIRVLDLETETKQQAYERFKVIFKDKPELVEMARPEALPASLWVRPMLMSAEELGAQLTAEFPNAELSPRPDVC
jgi:hypothetical protein